jgi:hypothetical protein
MRGALRGGQNPGRLVVADRLRGQAMPAGQVDRPQPAAALKVSRHCPADIDEKFYLMVQRYR